jgi:hypothetical protein
MADPDELRGSEPIMSSKAILLELWADMKVVRPAVERLQEEQLPKRILAIEQRHIAETAAERERGRLGTLTNKMLAGLILVTQAALAAWVAFKG